MVIYTCEPQDVEAVVTIPTNSYHPNRTVLSVLLGYEAFGDA